MTEHPDFCTVDCDGPRSYVVRRHSDKEVIGVYPNAELAWKVCKDFDRKYRRQWIKDQKKAEA
jgi:hypothetical protein